MQKSISYQAFKTIFSFLPPDALLWSRLDQELARYCHEMKTGLDVGCGNGSQLPENVSWVGVDIDLASLVQARKKGRYSALVRGDIQNLPFRAGSCDVVMALDVVEHLEKDRGLRLLHNMQKVAKLAVIVLTPNGYVKQEAESIKANPWMEHKSAWKTSDMVRLGYLVKGWSGLHIFGFLQHRIEALFQILITLSQPLVTNKPGRAFHLFCHKKLNRENISMVEI